MRHNWMRPTFVKSRCTPRWIVDRLCYLMNKKATYCSVHATKRLADCDTKSSNQTPDNLEMPAARLSTVGTAFLCYLRVATC